MIFKKYILNEFYAPQTHSVINLSTDVCEPLRREIKWVYANFYIPKGMREMGKIANLKLTKLCYQIQHLNEHFHQ